MHRRVRHLNPAQCGAQIALDARFITGVADGAALASWPSRPVASINATQGAGSSQPLYRASSINGRPAVEFDGSNDLMILSAPAVSLTNNVASAMATCVVVDDNAGDSQHNALTFHAGGSGSSSNLRLAVRARNTTAVGGAAGKRLDADGLTSTANTGSTANPAIVSANADYGAGNIVCVVNGVQSAAANFPSSGNTSATDSGATPVIGAGNTTGTVFRMDGIIAAVIVAVPMPSVSIRARIRHSLGFSFRIATH